VKRVSLAAAGLTATVLALSGCERGCLTTWWDSHTTSGAGGQQSLTPPPAEKPGCVSGFVRCSGGSVQASRAQVGTHCTPEGCLCPWDDIGKCAFGCVLEGVPIEMPLDAGVLQLCAPDDNLGPTAVVNREESGDAGDEVACEIEGFFCMNGRVSSCGNPRSAVCAHGCAKLDDVRLDEDDDLHAAALILCARK
jgi:hypothetical protein